MTTLAKMGRLPKKAGLARLVFEEPEPGCRPSFARYDDQIYLPWQPGARFHRLQRGRQFLFAPEGSTNRAGTVRGHNVWFGGTDERPFLAAVLSPAYDIFLKHGPRAFYDALKPRLITMLEKMFGVEGLRQGDMWAVPIPFDRKHINFMARMMGVHARVGWFGPVGRQSCRVLKTRHEITGYLSYHVEIAIDDENESYVETAEYGEGVLNAPDHKPLVLEGLHVLVQSRFLADAD